MRLDTYALKARIAPTSITALIPILVFNHFFVSGAFLRQCLNSEINYTTSRDLIEGKH